jgi:hypothetical protein
MAVAGELDAIVLWRGGEVDSIFGFASEHDALEWIREKSQVWLLENRR